MNCKCYREEHIRFLGKNMSIHVCPFMKCVFVEDEVIGIALTWLPYSHIGKCSMLAIGLEDHGIHEQKASV